jgi:hypothetical protein
MGDAAESPSTLDGSGELVRLDGSELAVYTANLALKVELSPQLS